MDPAALDALKTVALAVVTLWTAYQEYRWRQRCYTCPYYTQAVAKGAPVREELEKGFPQEFNE